jgi:hypothetical protein
VGVAHGRRRWHFFPPTPGRDPFLVLPLFGCAREGRSDAPPRWGVWGCGAGGFGGWWGDGILLGPEKTGPHRVWWVLRLGFAPCPWGLLGGLGFGFSVDRPAPGIKPALVMIVLWLWRVVEVVSWWCGVGVLFENCIVDASIFVVKLLRANGGCLGTRSR